MGVEEVGHVGVYIIKISLPEISERDLKYIEEIPSLFNSWSVTDNYALSVTQPLLNVYRDSFLPVLERWSLSANPWERRLSMVTFTRKVGASGKFTTEFLKLSANLIHDRDDLVRKGLGWALKDMMRGDRETILGYIKELRRAGVSSTVILYSIRDIKEREEREAVLNITKTGQ